MRSGISAGLLAALAAASASGHVTITSPADDGAGSLREAIAKANADASVTQIHVGRGVGTITLDSALTYTGTQPLTLSGEGVTIRAADAFAGDGLIVSSGDADLTLVEITLDGAFADGKTAANGVYIPVGPDASGMLAVTLDRVTLINHGLFGLHVADQLHDSPAGIRLTVNETSVTNCGIGALDYDGIRVDEGGPGDIDADIENTAIDANGGDGLELDERGPGSVLAEIDDTTFDDNGFFNEEDLDDGFDIDEQGPGDIKASLEDVTLNGNLDEGLDFDEEDAGDIDVALEDVAANGSTDEGIKFNEEGPGGIAADFEDVDASGNGDDGIELDESGDGPIDADFEDVTAFGNGRDGVLLLESGEGGIAGKLEDFVASNNDGSGLTMIADDAGTLDASLRRASFVSNTDYGVYARQDAPPPGRLTTRRLRTHGNGEGDFELDNVERVEQ
ncbi:MAG: hypothetical protein AAGK09_07850 [Planctomycetota bacterium]